MPDDSRSDRSSRDSGLPQLRFCIRRILLRDDGWKPLILSTLREKHFVGIRQP